MRVRSTGDTQLRFFKTAQVEVGANGEWSADFDFGSQDVDDTFEASISNAPVSVDAIDRIVAEEGDSDNKGDEDCATPTATDAAGEGDGCPGTVTDEPVTTTERPPETATEPDNSSNSPVPGFGVTVAIVALVAAALLALRREN